MIEANTRQPRLVIGDIGAMIGAGRLVAARCIEFKADFGTGAIDRAAEEILARSEVAMAGAIKRLPDGVSRGSADCDGHREPVHLAVTITVKGGAMRLDWSGSSLQREGSSINCVWNVTHAHSMVGLTSILLPDTPNNEGVFLPFTTDAPEGSILNARFPAPVRARSMVSFHLQSAIFEALAGVLGSRAAPAAPARHAGCAGHSRARAARRPRPLSSRAARPYGAGAGPAAEAVRLRRPLRCALPPWHDELGATSSHASSTARSRWPFASA